MLAPNIWNKHQPTYQELFWWVEEEYRGTTLGVRLLKVLEKQAPEGVKKAISILPDSNLKDSTLEKLGYKKAEMAFVKE